MVSVVGSRALTGVWWRPQTPWHRDSGLIGPCGCPCSIHGSFSLLRDSVPPADHAHGPGAGGREAGDKRRSIVSSTTKSKSSYLGLKGIWCWLHLLVVLCGELHAGWVEGLPRLYCLPEGVDGLGEQGPFSPHPPTLDHQPKGLCQLSRDRAHFLPSKWVSLDSLSVLLFQNVNRNWNPLANNRTFIPSYYLIGWIWQSSRNIRFLILGNLRKPTSWIYWI